MRRASKLFATVLVGLAGFAAPMAHAQDLFGDSDYADYSPDAENGALIFTAAGCAACHAIDGADDVLAGGMDFLVGRVGTLYAPNITPHPVHGIGDWSRTDFLNALLRGVSPEGEGYFGAVFPFPAYARMRPEDALDLQAYLNTLPQSDARSREHEVSFLGDSLLRIFSHDRPDLSEPADAQLARGEYLVEALGHCADCHTPREGRFSERLDYDSPFEGQTTIIGEFAGAINGARLEAFSPEAFVNGAMAQGLRLDGLPMASTIMRRVARATAQLPHDDRVAMYAYLTGTPIDPSTVEALEAPAGSSGGAGGVVVAGGAGGTQGGTSGATGTVVVEAAATIPDETGATGLAAQIEAYCRVPDEPVIEASLPASSAPAAPPAMDPAIEAAADAVIEEHCRSCHGPGMTYQRSFLTGSMAQMARDPSAVVPGDPQESRLYETIASNRMPTPSRPRMDAAELQAIVDWINALAPAGEEAAPAATAAAAVPTPEPAPRPELPEFAGGSFESLVAAAVADLGDVRIEDREFIRYFSFAHLPMPEVDCNREGALRNPMHYFHAALNKFINSVSRAPTLQQVRPVTGTEGALVAIDLRDFGWTSDDWMAISEGVHTRGALEAGFSTSVWADLVPLYPYAVDPSSDALLGVVAGTTGTRVPIMQADWFTRHASEAPIYDTLLRLPDNITDLEYRMGIDIYQEIRQLRIMRAGFLAESSGVSDHNRMLERFDLPRGGYYWRSYDFAGSDGVQSLILHPDGPAAMGRTVSGSEPFEHDGGEMIFSLPNGMQGYYLSLADGTRITEGPTSIVSFRDRPIGRGIEIVNARSCFSCHENGMISKSDEIREYILTNPTLGLEARDLLLRMYPEQDVVDDYYERDMEEFLQALDRINATETTVAGLLTSLRAPDGSGEIVTWLADFRFRRLDEEMVARRFFLTREEFRERTRHINDPYLAQVVAGWLHRFDMGLMVTQEEVDETWSSLLPRLTYYDALDYTAYAAGYEPPPVPQVPQESYEEVAADAVYVAVETTEDSYEPRNDVPEYTPPPVVDNPLELTLHVPRQQVYVDELLTFEVEANRACTLQIIYVEINDSIVELPASVIGAQPLAPGERRLIPQPASGLQLRFDSPGVGETLLAFCREPSSAQPALDADEMLALARERYQPLFRGLTIEAAERTEEDLGRSAFASVTIDVIGD